MAGNTDAFKKAMNDGHSAAWDQDWNKALAFYQAALVEFPQDAKALISLGMTLFELQRLEEALQAYYSVARLTPEDPIPFERIAVISERLGQLKTASQAAMQAADLYIKNHNVDKAIENWKVVTQITPENGQAHLNLAMVQTRLGKNTAAGMQYLALAAVLQRSGNTARAGQMIARSMELMPNSPEARQASSLLRSGQLLPMPARPKGGTGPLRMESIHQLESSRTNETSLDPISAARKTALTELAELLFDYSELSDDEPKPSRRGMSSIVKGTGALLLKKGDSPVILLHLGQAIDAQLNENDDQAADELEKALEAGYSHAALFFDLGFLRSRGDRLESALRNLEHAVGHPHYSLGSRLLMGQILRKMNRLNEASIHYLEALKLADLKTVPEQMAEPFDQAYETIKETQAQQSDPVELEKVCAAIDDLLNQKGWEAVVTRRREQMPANPDDPTPVPLAEVIIQARTSYVIEAMSNVRNLTRDGYMRSAMEEAFNTLQTAPSYLPIHQLIADLLVQEGRQEDAISKLTVVARAYAARGESKQSARTWQKVVRLAPMDIPSRTRLIDQLLVIGQPEAALKEYLELAGLYYHQADLDLAHKTYATALKLCQESKVDSDWNIRILKHMADIDLQRLDWRQACRINEQIRTLRPDDMTARKQIVDLNIRLQQFGLAEAEIEDYLARLEASGARASAIPFLEALLKDYPRQAFLLKSMAAVYASDGQVNQAIDSLDKLGDLCLENGDTQSAIQAMEKIISLNPPNVSDYRAALASLKEKQ